MDAFKEIPAINFYGRSNVESNIQHAVEKDIGDVDAPNRSHTGNVYYAEEWDSDENDPFHDNDDDRDRLWDNGIIDPKDSRKVLGLSLASALNYEEKPSKFDLKQPCTDSNPCPPGYTCPATEESVCELKDSCFKYKMDPLNPWPDAWTLICLQDGTWAAKQCKAEANNGRCFCYDAVGNRIFGQAFLDKSANMTCEKLACSRRKEELRNKKLRFYTTLHCDSIGNYEPLQCDEGQCWCVESQTGEIISQVVPDTMMTLLPCYSENEVGTTYVRPCESEEYAQKILLHELNLHGTELANFPHIMCDDDVNYGYYQIVGAQ
ncbi:hypothetical protein FQA39_LY10814 [Lamprigera yunnana]|nr:hypothetical protein FQA39_LY10814 [Lamprigera yunnana]